MRTYLNLLHGIYCFGEKSDNRTGIKTRALFGTFLEYDLKEGFPLVTTKKMFLRGIIEELLWFLRGETNIKPLVDKGVHIWDEWADEDGNLGPVYGKMWRDFNGVDQIDTLIKGLKENPNSRRHIVSAWNPPHLPIESIHPKENAAMGRMALAPCHVMFQCKVHPDKRLSMIVTMRSVDSFLGMPFNIASYAALVHILCALCDLKPGVLRMSFADTHIYENHIPQVRTQTRREPYSLPSLTIKPFTHLDELTFEHFELSGYESHPALKGDIAV